MKTILQVEDDPNDVFFLQHAVKKLGIDIALQVATDGQQAIDYLQGAGKFADRRKFPLPCLVLLDLKLPFVMGLDVLSWIRKEYDAALPVIMLTASGEETDIASAYRLGANAFLTKPSEVTMLQDIVRAISDFWLVFNLLPDHGAAQASRDRAVPIFRVLPGPAIKMPSKVLNGRARKELVCIPETTL